MHSKFRNFVRERRRLVSVIVYGAINALPQLTNVVLVILYASAFSLVEYGAFGILTVIVGLVGIGLDLGVPQAILRNFYDFHNDLRAAREYVADITFSAGIVAVATLPLLGLALYFGWFVFDVGRTYALIYILLILGTAFFDRSLEMLGAIFRVLDRPFHYAAGRVAQTLASLAAGVIFVFLLHLTVVGALLAMMFGRMAGAVVYEALLRFDLGVRGGRFRWTGLKACLSFGLPLVPNRLAGWARTAALRPVLVGVIPLGEIGLFSLASSVSALPLLISTAVDLALSPHYFKQRVANSEGFTQRIEHFGTVSAAALMPLWAALVVFCPELIRIFAGQRYEAAAPVCAILLCASFVRAQHPFLLRQIHFLRETWILPAMTIPCAALSIVLALLLASRFGLSAVGWAALIADASLYVALAVMIRIYERVHHPMAITLGLTAVLGLLASWVALEEPAPLDWPGLAAKTAIVAIVAIGSFAVWIWPNRAFIRDIAKR